MASWNSLPPEIHDHILRLFCNDILATYTALESDIDYHVLQWIKETTLRWPAPPQCLQHISSATKTCRSFYHSIAHGLKTNGVSPMEQLQLIQFNRVRDIISHSQLPHDEDDQTVGQVHVGLFITLAGVFWKNPKVLESPL